MSTVIAFANQKGGVGKTTSVHNVASTLAIMGKKTLMIDLDPQATLTVFVGLKPHELDETIASVLDKGGKMDGSIWEVKPNLDIVPSNETLSDVEFDIPRRRMPDLILQRALQPAKNEYDYVLIDCPPHLGTLTLNALAAADYVLMPCATDYAPFIGLQRLMSAISEVQLEVNQNLKVMGVIATMYMMNANDDKNVLQELQNKYNVIAVVKRLVIAKSTIYEHAAVIDVEPYNDIALEYKKVAEYIIDCT